MLRFGLRMTPEDDFLPSVACPPPQDGVFWIYLLQSADGALYIGQTRNVEERLRKHRLGVGSKHTHDHPGVRLVFVEQHTSLTAPFAREAQLKRWSRAKKLALIAGDASRLRDLSRNRESRYSDPGAEK